MLEAAFFQRLTEIFPHTPTASQSAVLQTLSSFLTNEKSPEKLFLLKGFAGTGKTTIIASLVSILEQTNINTILLAPLEIFFMKKELLPHDYKSLEYSP